MLPIRVPTIPALLLTLGLCMAGLLPAFPNDALPERLSGHGGPVKAISIHPDGVHALTGSFDYSIIHWALRGSEGEALRLLTGHKAAVNDVAFVPGSGRAVSVGDDGALAVWDLSDGKLLAFFEDSDAKGLGVAVSADGKLAAAARWDKTVRLYDLQTLSERARFEGHRGNVNAVVFSGDGSELFSAAYDGTVRSWNIAGQANRVIYSHGWGINVLARLPDGRLAFGALDGTVGVVSPDSGEHTIIGIFERPILSITVSQARGMFATGGADGHIRVFDIASLAQVEDYGEPYGPVWAMDFLPNGKSVYRGGLDDFAARWQIEPRQPFEKVTSTYPRRFQVSASDDPGETEFKRKCSVCHTLTPDGGNRAGPTLYHLFGRKAGEVAGYPYTDALKNSGIVWTEVTVARLFDEGPDLMVPGTKMPLQRLKAVVRRDALIEYLKRATAPELNKPAQQDKRD